jgi:hypothetical protein
MDHHRMLLSIFYRLLRFLLGLIAMLIRGAERIGPGSGGSMRLRMSRPC